MASCKIEFTNMKEALDGIEARKKKLLDVPKAARQMGILALNEIHPLTNKLSHTWDNSITAEVTQVSSFKWQLWVGSKGAFNKQGYNYGKRQEDLYHPISIGWHKAWPRMVDQWNKVVHGVAGRTISSEGSFGESIASEFGNMAGF